MPNVRVSSRVKREKDTEGVCVRKSDDASPNREVQGGAMF